MPTCVREGITQPDYVSRAEFAEFSATKNTKSTKRKGHGASIDDRDADKPFDGPQAAARGEEVVNASRRGNAMRLAFATSSPRVSACYAR